MNIATPFAPIICAVKQLAICKIFLTLTKLPTPVKRSYIKIELKKINIWIKRFMLFVR